MELTLSKNIRTLRKERNLTQEQFAEVMGVTTGAVHKWESGLSVPELDLIVEMADFFDTSVDVLLGYKMKDNRLSATIDRLSRYCRTRDPEALIECEKALKKYPHSFQVVHTCAGIYAFFGVGGQSREKTRRALELYEQALLLVSQNTDPKISEFTLYGEMAGAYMVLGDFEKGVELMKCHNAGGMFSDTIGSILAAHLHRPEEAEPYLSAVLLQNVNSLLNAVAGFSFVFTARGDCASAQAVLQWGIDLLNSLRREPVTDFLEKLNALQYLLLAHAQIKTGQTEQACASLRQARALAARFDAAPDYGVRNLRFVTTMDTVSVTDIFGATAAESLENLLRLIDDPALSRLWKEIKDHE